jgi:hypothetical protein
VCRKLEQQHQQQLNHTKNNSNNSNNDSCAREMANDTHNGYLAMANDRLASEEAHETVMTTRAQQAAG